MKRIIASIIICLALVGFASKTTQQIGTIEAFVYAEGAGGLQTDGVFITPNGMQNKVTNNAKYTGMYSSTIEGDDVDYDMYFPITTNKTLELGSYIQINVIKKKIYGITYNISYVAE